MSKYVQFLSVKKPNEEDFPQIIDRDDPGCALAYYPEKEFHPLYASAGRCEKWKRDFGIRRTIEYMSADMFKVGTAIFGKKVVSIGGGWKECILSFADNSVERVPLDFFDKYKEKVQHVVYVYEARRIADIESGYLLDTDDIEGRVLTAEELKAKIKQYMESESFDEDSIYSCEPLIGLIKAYICADEGEQIVCISD